MSLSHFVVRLLTLMLLTSQIFLTFFITLNKSIKDNGRDPTPSAHFRSHCLRFILA
jgi:hypothetical protein